MTTYEIPTYHRRMEYIFKHHAVYIFKNTPLGGERPDSKHALVGAIFICYRRRILTAPRQTFLYQLVASTLRHDLWYPSSMGKPVFSCRPPLRSAPTRRFIIYVSSWSGSNLRTVNKGNVFFSHPSPIRSWDVREIKRNQSTTRKV